LRTQGKKSEAQDVFKKHLKKQKQASDMAYKAEITQVIAEKEYAGKWDGATGTQMERLKTLEAAYPDELTLTFDESDL
jgi:hypothetical protein